MLSVVVDDFLTTVQSQTTVRRTAEPAVTICAARRTLDNDVCGLGVVFLSHRLQYQTVYRTMPSPRDTVTAMPRRATRVNRRHERGTSSPDIPDAQRWNHNIQYHPLLLTAVPTGADRVLDVGCGDGHLTRQLAAQAEHVVGIDLDKASIGLAIEHTREPNIEYVHGDVLAYVFEPGSFDAVVSVATLHHMDTARGLRRLATLVRPGGVVAVIGIGRPHIVEDLPWQIAGTVATRYHRLSKPLWEHSAPIVWPPPHTNRQVKAIAAAELPRAVFRRHVMWRYSLIWTKPPSDR